MIEHEEFNGEGPDDRPAPLSAAGLARRREMLGSLQAALVRKRRRRSAARWAALAVAPASIAAVCLGLWSRGVPPRSEVPARSGSWLEVIHDDPGVVERYAVHDVPVDRGVLIGDEELLELLRAANRPSGLIRVEGKVFLTSSLPGPEPAGGPDGTKG